MVQDALQGRPPSHAWIPLDDLPRNAAIAVIAAEDQLFFQHSGFDFEAIEDALERNARRKGRRIRGASTISQQVAKNLFLWRGKSFVRKGLEAYFTILIEALWPKQRILEVYLNVAEFGERTYGVGAASRHFFGKSAQRLTAEECALLAVVLPNPRELKAGEPSEYVLKRQAFILGQMYDLEHKTRLLVGL
jgi:monofunctional biosynthetic peptidoglycan transglycosylase